MAKKSATGSKIDKMDIGKNAVIDKKGKKCKKGKNCK